MPRHIIEDRTRKEMINPQLERAGWYLRDHSRVKEEIPACPATLREVNGYDAEPWNGVTEYCLYRENGGVLNAQPFQTYITQHNYNADQIRFLRMVQSVFLQKHHLETTDTSTGSRYGFAS
jgi:hypothetical protein